MQPKAVMQHAMVRIGVKNLGLSMIIWYNNVFRFGKRGFFDFNCHPLFPATQAGLKGTCIQNLISCFYLISFSNYGGLRSGHLSSFGFSPVLGGHAVSKKSILGMYLCICVFVCLCLRSTRKSCGLQAIHPSCSTRSHAMVHCDPEKAWPSKLCKKCHHHVTNTETNTVTNTNTDALVNSDP